MTNRQATNAADLSFDEDQACIYRGGPFTGTAAYYRADGTLESEVEYLHGVQDGWVRDWNVLGVLTLEAEVKNGAYHGSVRYFSDHGSICREEEYEFGICTIRREVLEGVMRETFVLDSSSETFKVLQAMRQAVR